MILDVKYETGLLWQDIQHQEWIGQLNELKAAKANHKGADAFNQAIAFNVMYANYHFGIEEAYMKKYDYPEHKFHAEEHRLCILRLKDFREKYRDYSDEAGIWIVESMTEWVYSHIMENDKKLGAFIIEREQPSLIVK